MQILGTNVKIANRDNVVIPGPPENGVINIFAQQLYSHGRSQGSESYTRNVVPIYNLQMSNINCKERTSAMHGRPFVTSVVSSGRS